MSVPPDAVGTCSPERGGEEGVTTFVDLLLTEQRQLTAAEKFSQLHEQHTGPSLAPHYRDLIPLTAPRPGEQYAFEVNLDQCSGCKGCVTACHALNGLDDDEAWRSVGFLVGEAVVPLASTTPRAFVPPPGNRVIPLQQTVTTACHHCVEPACMLGCPVLAYDKDPVTGIVRHLDDQCIGCSYCILKCPYEVPRYSPKRGIVRKCDMCHGRLAEGEAPACVQACPNEAIRIALVTPTAFAIEFRKPGVAPSPPPQKESSSLDMGHSSSPIWLPDAPEPAYTLPTTRYVSARPNGALLAADHARPTPAPAHWPLVFMLTLTQAGIGGLFAVASLKGFAFTIAQPSVFPLLAAISFAFLVAGLVASVFHLGQPRKAWRVWLGWRTSWLSREAIALNALAGVATGVLALLWVDHFNPRLASQIPPEFARLLSKAGEVPAWLWAVPLLMTGLAALWAQTMVYADTHRHFWRVGATAPRFLGTALILGFAIVFALEPSSVTAGLLAFVTTLKLAVELATLKEVDSDELRWTQLRRSAALQLGPLRLVLAGRFALGALGGIAVPFAFAAGTATPAWTFAAVALLLLGEFAERYLFFTAVSPDKMPGLPR